MGYRHDRDEILGQAVREALETGVSRLTFGAVARRMGINDRSIVYYFPTKDALVASVVGELGARLRTLLARAIGDEPLPPQEVFDRAWRLLATPSSDPVFGLFFEVVGLGAAGVEPYAGLGRAVLAGWTDWLAERVDEASAAERRTAATAVVGSLDGMLLVRALAGPRAANAAARRIRLV